MVRPSVVEIFIFLVVVDTAFTAVFNSTWKDVDNAIKPVKTRRKNERSTSSSSGEKRKNTDVETDGDKESLQISSSEESSSSDEVKKKYPEPQSTAERKGWRKWHRKCSPCREDMSKKWRDPSIGWICGAYQRARRSFKSDCMMRLRNCQDGTMFVKITNRRCENDTANIRHGDHFFYDYKVTLSGDSTDTGSGTSSTGDYSDESSTDSELSDFRRQGGNQTKNKHD